MKMKTQTCGDYNMTNETKQNEVAGDYGKATAGYKGYATLETPPTPQAPHREPLDVAEQNKQIADLTAFLAPFAHDPEALWGNVEEGFLESFGRPLDRENAYDLTLIEAAMSDLVPWTVKNLYFAL